MMRILQDYKMEVRLYAIIFKESIEYVAVAVFQSSLAVRFIPDELALENVAVGERYCTLDVLCELK